MGSALGTDSHATPPSRNLAAVFIGTRRLEDHQDDGEHGGAPKSMGTTLKLVEERSGPTSVLL